MDGVRPGVDSGHEALLVLVGPDRIFGKHGLGNLKSRRLQITRSVYLSGGWTKKHDTTP